MSEDKMRISIVAFDDFTDVDVWLMWDLLNRVGREDWQVRILAEKEEVTSSTGIKFRVHGFLNEASESDAVLFASGKGTRRLIHDEKFLRALNLNAEKQLIGSMCSGALILAALGLLDGKKATTYPTAKKQLESFGVEVIEKPFVQEGNVATAAGCLSAQYLAGWVIETLASKEEKEKVLSYIQPVGEGLFFADYEEKEFAAKSV
jgi:transcriptional regulator GlxA family with amidase domain